MDVVENEDERSIACGCFEEPADRPERLFTPARVGDPHHLRDMPANLILMLLALEDRADLRLDDVGEVEVRQAGRLLDRLDDREIRDSLAVREASTAEDESRGSSSDERNSSTKRDFPTPADPMTVKS